MKLLAILVGVMLGGTATLIFAFEFYNVPYTNNGINYLLVGAMPAGAICGGMAAALIIYRTKKRQRHQNSN